LFNFIGTGNLFNQDMIQELNSNATITVNPNVFFSCSGTLPALHSFPTRRSSDLVTAPNFTNTGTLALDTGGTINLNGSYTTAGLHLASIVRTCTHVTLNIQGARNNAGDTLALTATTGSFRLNGGTITGGAITAAG